MCLGLASGGYDPDCITPVGSSVFWKLKRCLCMKKCHNGYIQFIKRSTFAGLWLGAAFANCLVMEQAGFVYSIWSVQTFFM